MEKAKKKLTRRTIVLGAAAAAGGLAVGYVLTRPARRPTVAKAVAGDGEQVMATWIKLAKDGIVTVYVPASEMGQGVHTSLAMMAAEEMDADWSMVRIEQAPAKAIFANDALAKGYLTNGMIIPAALTGPVDFTFRRLAEFMNLQITGGSTSVRFTGRYGMCLAGAAARDMLMHAAAERWNVPVSECTTTPSQVHHRPSNRSAAYGDLAEAAGKLSAPADLPLKTPKEYRIVGKSTPRNDIPAKVDGSAKFGIDARPDGLLYAAILHAPVWGGQVESYDASAALKRRGVKEVVKLKDAVAVVADNYWRAEQALKDVKVSFTDGGNGKVDSASIFRMHDEAIRTGKGKKDVEKGNANQALSGAKVIEATYRAPYLAHACMEPMNCTVAPSKDGKTADVWVSTQDNLTAASVIAKTLGIGLEGVTIHPVYLGGGFGRRGPASNDYMLETAAIAKQVGAPVKLVWSREEDIRRDGYRPALTSSFRAALDASGKPVAWSNRYVEKNEPAEAAHIPYAVANQSIRFVECDCHVPTGPWRSVAHSAHTFFTESFVDELAHAAGKDPYAYRRELLADAPRHRRVLDLAAQKAGWSTSPAPGRARGIAIQQAFGSIVCEVAEISLDAQGEVKVERVVAAVDCGPVVNPDNAVQQIEGGIIYGLTAALYGEIGIKDGGAAQSNFTDYRMIGMGQAPVIEVHFAPPDGPYGGLGEPGTPPVAAAVANAVFALTGQRIRELPLARTLGI